MKQDAAAAVLDWLGQHERRMIQVLEEVVNIDSGSGNKAGVDRVAAVFRRELEASGLTVRTFPMSQHGDCMVCDIAATQPADNAQGHAMLLGHMDTVFPDGTAALRPFRIADGRAYGPGVADMKAGLVMNTFIAKAFAQHGGLPRPLRVMYTGDEEIASPSSRELTRQMAIGAAMVLNAEPGRPTGNVVIQRKGAFFIDFETDGIAAHAGVNHDKGASAIDAMARKILALHALTNPDIGVTTSVGTLKGGISINTVAPHAQAQLDVRFPGCCDQHALHDTIRQIIEREDVGRTQGRITREADFLPLPTSPAGRWLFDCYAQSAQRIGFSVQGEATGGCADSGLTASVGAPTLCATGPVGGHAHTPDEYCDLASFVPRAQAVALTLLTPQSLPDAARQAHTGVAA